VEQKEPMTKYGFQRLSDELNTLKNVDLPAVNVEIDRAKEYGDLKENSEYHAAREKQIVYRHSYSGTRRGDFTVLKSLIRVELEHARISFWLYGFVLCDLDSDQEVTYYDRRGMRE